jgi:hypothetical protein
LRRDSTTADKRNARGGFSSKLLQSTVTSFDTGYQAFLPNARFVCEKSITELKLMARRVRTTITVREDDPVPRRRSKKKQSSAVVVVILILLAFFLLARTNRSHGPQPQRVVAPR